MLLGQAGEEKEKEPKEAATEIAAVEGAVDQAAQVLTAAARAVVVVESVAAAVAVVAARGCRARLC